MIGLSEIEKSSTYGTTKRSSVLADKTSAEKVAEKPINGDVVSGDS